MHLTGLDLLLWAAGFGAHLTLFLVLLIRKRAKTFPIFTAFIIVNVIRTVSLYFVQAYGGKATYFYTFWAFGVLDTCLQLLVVYEMSSLTFRPLGVWAHDTRGAFLSLISMSIAVATGLTWLATPHTKLWMQTVVIKGNFFSSVCMSELFVGTVALAVSVGLPWKTHVARISQGLGVYSILGVLIEAAHSYFGVNRNIQIYTALSHFRMLAYLCCVGYWISMLWRDPPEPRKMVDNLHTQLTHLLKIADGDLVRVRARRSL
jgi:hypothetical protein